MTQNPKKASELLPTCLYEFMEQKRITQTLFSNQACTTASSPSAVWSALCRTRTTQFTRDHPVPQLRPHRRRMGHVSSGNKSILLKQGLPAFFDSSRHCRKHPTISFPIELTRKNGCLNSISQNASPQRFNPTTPTFDNIHITPNNPQYRIVEIFESLQGEGWSTGMPAVFIRLNKCNLACSWCDTDYLKFGMMSLSDILGRLKAYGTAQHHHYRRRTYHPTAFGYLLNALKAEGYFLCIETNGLNPAPPPSTTLPPVPKPVTPLNTKSCIEREQTKCALSPTSDVISFARDGTQNPRPTLLSFPCEQDGAMNIYDTIRQIGVNQPSRRPRLHWQPERTNA